LAHIVCLYVFTLRALTVTFLINILEHRKDIQTLQPPLVLFWAAGVLWLLALHLLML
jgi:hypothetical protein